MDHTEVEPNLQRIDNVTIGLVVGISIVLFFIIIINCFTFRIYLKQRKGIIVFDSLSFPSNQ